MGLPPDVVRTRWVSTWDPSGVTTPSGESDSLLLFEELRRNRSLAPVPRGLRKLLFSSLAGEPLGSTVVAEAAEPIEDTETPLAPRLMPWPLSFRACKITRHTTNAVSFNPGDSKQEQRQYKT